MSQMVVIFFWLQVEYTQFNRFWECVFQSPDVKQEHIIIRGKHGLDLVYAYIVYFSHIPKIEENHGGFVSGLFGQDDR